MIFSTTNFKFIFTTLKFVIEPKCEVILLEFIIEFKLISHPGKFCNRLLTEILTEVPISHSLTEFNQPFNR